MALAEWSPELSDADVLSVLLRLTHKTIGCVTASAECAAQATPLEAE